MSEEDCMEDVESVGQVRAVPAGYEDMDDQPEVRLKSGIDLSDIRSGEGAVFEVEEEDPTDKHTQVQKEYFNPSEIFSGTCGHMPGFDSDDEEEEDDDDSRTPFEKLAVKMTSITEDGGVKKRIFKQGVGGNLQDGNVVRIHYQGYTEYGDDPFDSTVMRSQPFKVLLGKGAVIPGLEIGLQTMKKKEQAQLLISPQYAFGELGCEPRIPRNATLVYNVEVIDAQDSAGADEFFLLNRDDRKTLELDLILKYVKDEITKGNKYVKTEQYGRAAGRFKTCLKILLERGPKDEKEERLMQKEELRANNNLAVVCLKQNSLGQVIFYANNSLGIEPKNAKALYLKGKALMKKGDFSRAEESLQRAEQQAPGDKDISKTLKELAIEKKKFHAVEKKMYKNMFASLGKKSNNEDGAADSNDSEKSAQEKQDFIKNVMEPSAANDEFKQCMRESLGYFVDNNELMEMPFPRKDFTTKEVAAMLEIVEEMGLHYKEVGEGSNAHIYLLKKKPTTK